MANAQLVESYAEPVVSSSYFAVGGRLFACYVEVVVAAAAAGAPTTSDAPVAVASSSASLTVTVTTGGAGFGVATSSASGLAGGLVVTSGGAAVGVQSGSASSAAVTGLAFVGVATSAVTTLTGGIVTTAGAAPFGVGTSGDTATVGLAATTGIAPVTVSTSSATSGVSVVGPWVPDDSTGEGTIGLDIPDAVIRLDPVLAAPPSVGFAERAITMQVQSMPALTLGADGRYHSDGNFTTTETVVGVPHLFVDGIDVTYLRGFPSRIQEWSFIEPGGEETAVVGFPQVMPFETTGEVGRSELYWLGADRDLEIAVVEADGTRHYVWSGFLVSDELRLSATNVDNEWHARGVLFGAASAVKHRAKTWMPPTDIGTVIPDVLNAVPARRYAPIPRVVTGIMTTDRGSTQDSVWDHVQRLLATAWTEDGHQWTIARVGRAQYAMVLKDDTVTHTMQTGARGVEHTLSRDKTQAPNIIWGRGVGPDGYGWARWHYPNLDFGAGIDAAYLDDAYRLPVAADPRVQPGHVEFDPKVVPTEIEVDFGTNITLDEAIRSAELQLSRDENAGLVGTITLHADPAEGSRVLMQAGAVLEYKNLRGGDYIHDFADWRLRASRVHVDLWGDGMPVTLTVDSRARDAMSLVSILKRNRDAAIDPARQPGAVNRRSRQEQDAVVPFDGEAGGGIIPSHYVPARQWTCFWRPLNEVGRIVNLTYHSESRFCLALFAGDITPSHLDAWVGDPLAVKGPFDANFDALLGFGYIDAWGQLDDAAGYSPYCETASEGRIAGPFNGDLIETNNVEYVGYQNLWIKVCEWSADGGLMSGRILPGVEA